MDEVSDGKAEDVEVDAGDVVTVSLVTDVDGVDVTLVVVDAAIGAPGNATGRGEVFPDLLAAFISIFLPSITTVLDIIIFLILLFNRAANQIGVVYLSSLFYHLIDCHCSIFHSHLSCCSFCVNRCFCR